MRCHKEPLSVSSDTLNFVSLLCKNYVSLRSLNEYELQVSNIEEIKQQVADLWQTFNTAFERRDFCISVFPVFLILCIKRLLID